MVWIVNFLIFCKYKSQIYFREDSENILSAIKSP